MSEYTYEIQGCVQVGDDVQRCLEGEPEFWGIYRRPVEPNEVGHHLAEWVADRPTLPEAQELLDRIKTAEPNEPCVHCGAAPSVVYDGGMWRTVCSTGCVRPVWTGSTREDALSHWDKGIRTRRLRAAA